MFRRHTQYTATPKIQKSSKFYYKYRLNGAKPILTKENALEISPNALTKPQYFNYLKLQKLIQRLIIEETLVVKGIGYRLPISLTIDILGSNDILPLLLTVVIGLS